MSRLQHTSSFGIGSNRAESGVATLFDANHFASEKLLPAYVTAQIASLGLERVAGSIYECPSTKDFWKVKGTSIVRMAEEEVDNNEHVAAAPAQAPMGF